MSQILSISSGPRQSNFELLRILAMFLVLVTHADYVSIGLPSLSEIDTNPTNAYTRILFESISIVCVNIFILISGWFGIKPSVKGFANFIFQCAYFYMGLYLLFLVAGKTQLSSRGIIEAFCLARSSWFVPSYIGLYILSPILNLFAQSVSKRKLEIFLISFFLFQTYFSLLRTAAFIAEGYSTFSFIGLYLLARYLHMYNFKLNNIKAMCVYCICVIVNVAIYAISKRWFPVFITFNYVNPFVILGALSLLMLFSNIRIKPNRTINFISKSSFAVFLMHTNQMIYPKFIAIIHGIYQYYSGFVCIGVLLLFLLAVYAVCTISDFPRRFIWQLISKHFNWDCINSFIFAKHHG